MTLRSPKNPQYHGGFTLVISVALLVLLMIIALGTLSLSGIALRSSERSLWQAQARANARCALLLAIGELQRQAGPDQRITAPASIMDSVAETESVQDVGEPLVAGVWSAHQQNPNNPPSIPQYDKRASFRRWLVSGLSTTAPHQMDQLRTSPFRHADNGVCLVGKRTSRDPQEGSPNHLWAGKMPLNQSGHGAYAVIDEGVKARIDLATPANRTAVEQSRAAAGMPARHAFELARQSSSGQGQNLQDYFAVREQAAKAITLASGPLLRAGLPDLGAYFQDFTTESAGVLADVTGGGLRKDLSLFGELPTIPTDYADRRIYSDTNQPFFSVPNTANFVGGSPDPFWNMVYERLNSHRRLTAGNGNQVPNHTLANTLPSRYRPGTSNAATGTWQSMNRAAQPNAPLAPVILRAEFLFSFFAKETRGHQPWEWEVSNAFGGGSTGSAWNHMLHLIYTPIITLWNPYNVQLRLGQPVIEIANPPVAFRFIRHRSPAVASMGEVTNRLIPLDEMYVNGWDKFDKKFVMQLFGQVSSSGVANGNVILQPGEVRVFSPAVDPSWNFVNVFDWQNNLTDRSNYAAQIRAAPGWRGPQYGFNIDWLTGDPSSVISPRNGTSYNLGVIGTQLNDLWDIECGLALPRRKDGSAIGRYAVSLLTSSGTSNPASPNNVISRLEFDFHADSNVLTRALTSTSAVGTRIPFKMSDFSNPERSSNVRVGFSDPMRNWIVRPFMVLSAQAKSTTENDFPSKPWIQNDAARPLSYQSLRDDHQAWNSHELVLMPYRNGMATDAKVDAQQRGFGFGGSTPLFGSSFLIHRELPLTPVQSLAQLGHFGLASSAFPGAVDHPVGNSWASPLIPSHQVQTNQSVDHCWLANHRLWDSWYASTLTNQRAYWPTTKNLQQVIQDFVSETAPLPNSRLRPRRNGRTAQEITPILARSATEPQADAYLKAAALQMLDGAFNVNSTSQAAWMALLGGLDRTTLSSLVWNGTQTAIDDSRLITTGPFLTRRRMPLLNGGSASAGAGDRFNFWNGGCQLTQGELEALAAGIVREVKRRGPFLSLAEFVNRRVAPVSPLSLKGAIQAAIDDAPGLGNLNTNAQTSRRSFFASLAREISQRDLQGIPYANPNAALGNNALGAGGALDQAAVLTQIGASLSARSDTFRIRAYGDSTDANGKVIARAWCEAVVQRVPEFLVSKAQNGNDPWETPATATMHPINQALGRRLEIRSFRWLTAQEI